MFISVPRIFWGFLLLSSILSFNNSLILSADSLSFEKLNHYFLPDLKKAYSQGKFVLDNLPVAQYQI